MSNKLSLFLIFLCCFFAAAPSMADSKNPANHPFRAAWVTTVANTDWPSSPYLNAQQQQEEFIELLDGLQALGFNAVIVQVHPLADAFWPSKTEPWSFYLTGQQGKDPGYNPLAFMIEQTHKRNMEFHAWFNPYRVQHLNKIPLAANHPANLHPKWLIQYDQRIYYNPALPQVRQHIVDVVREVVQNYDVDAIHFDDYFYPYPAKKYFIRLPFPDRKDYKRFGQGLSKADWRRENVNILIRDIHQMIKQEKPHVKFGISPFGVWRNQEADPTGSATRGISNYDDIYADTRTWMANGWIDYIVPQLYYPFDDANTPFDTLLDWWIAETNKFPSVTLYIGLGTYQTFFWTDSKELEKQIDMLRQKKVAGEVHFTASSILQHPYVLRRIKRAYGLTD